MNIAEATVKNHLHNILEKLHLQSRIQAVARAIRDGIISTEDIRQPGSPT
ncbi:MAG: LuxR C-terminal-related transcriptional regulator [Dehalococcoidia bacterium]|jgi:DNA-binding NarL/FixJ family response regulator|nr:LuxR C-terminal-related transcriptional regulator [Dehalococcoidia bacterium]|tara:strand:+ start:160 stop:309 length:150 start_codon:yes stop_codon:yes gene_type:complete